MPRVLVTAFEPFDAWKANSSWLTLVELTKDLPAGPELTTRLYPVDFAGLQQRLLEDLCGATIWFCIWARRPAVASSGWKRWP